MLKTALTLLLLTQALTAAVTYTVTNLNIPTAGCSSLASNGNVACAYLGSVYFYNSTTGTTSTVSGFPNMSNAYVNATGQIAGQASSGSDYFYNGSTVVTLPNSSQISGIDNLGDIVGGNGSGFGVLWTTSGSNITYQYAPAAIAQNSNPAISSNGIIAYDIGGNLAIWNLPASTTTSEGTAPGTGSAVSGVSTTGSIAGGGYVSSGFYGPLLEVGGTVTSPCSSATNCQGLSNVTGGYFNDVNASNQAVGDILIAASYHAFLYSGGSLKDLNSLLANNLNTVLGGSGWYLQTATSINDSGQILVTASNGPNYSAVLLTPVTTGTPEPATFVLTASAIFYLIQRSMSRRRASSSL